MDRETVNDVKKVAQGVAKDVAERTVIQSYQRVVTPLLKRLQKLGLWEMRLILAVTGLLVLVLTGLLVLIVVAIVALF